VRLRPATTDGPASSEVSLCSLDVAPVVRDYSLPSPAYPSQAVLGGVATLLGLDASTDSVQAGETVQVRLYFQALFTPDTEYSVFLHILDRDGRVLTETNAQPTARPMGGWLPGEVVAMDFDLTVPEGTPPGQYVYEVGWFQPDVAGMPRVPATLGGQALPNDSVILGKLDVR